MVFRHALSVHLVHTLKIIVQPPVRNVQLEQPLSFPEQCPNTTAEVSYKMFIVNTQKQ